MDKLFIRIVPSAPCVHVQLTLGQLGLLTRSCTAEFTRELRYDSDYEELYIVSLYVGNILIDRVLAVTPTRVLGVSTSLLMLHEDSRTICSFILFPSRSTVCLELYYLKGVL